MLLAIFGWYVTRNESEIVIMNSEIANTGTTSTAIKATPKSTTIQVYITGCVAIPQVVELPEGSIVKDAVEKAGGFTDKADQQAINLVYKLTDNVMIKIPSIDESNADKQNWLVNGFQPKSNNDIANGGKVSLNTASDKELMELPGVGESTAKAIVTYREKNGKFNTINDVMKVAGIKQAKFDSIKDYIKV